MVAACFVPPEEIRQLRTLTRYRRHLTEERSREKHRAEKLLEDALLKLSVVVSDLHGVSSREIMEALIAGCRDPKALAQLARGRLRAKMAALEEALDGADTFSDHHAFVLAMMLDNIDRLSAQIDKLTAQIDELIAPFERQVAQLDAVTGFGRTAAQDLIAETGVDMSVFPTAAHLVSWAKFCPQVKESAGKRKGRNARGKGNRYVAGVLGEAAVDRRAHPDPPRRPLPAPGQTPGQAQGASGHGQHPAHHRLRPAVGPHGGVPRPRCRLLRRPNPPPRQVNSHLAALQRLGYKVTLDLGEAA